METVTHEMRSEGLYYQCHVWVFLLGGEPKLNQSTRNQEVPLLKSLRAITDTVIEDIHIYISDLPPQGTDQAGAWTTHPGGMEEIVELPVFQPSNSICLFFFYTYKAFSDG